jgi:outer membrane protein TolC
LNAFVDVNYDLYTMGQRQATIRAAEEQVRFSELEVKRRQEQLRLDTANLYYTLQQAREGIRINQAFLDEASENLRTSRIRQQEGVGTQFDVLRAEVQFANARQNLIQSQSDEKVAQRDLARLLNLPPMVAVQSTPVKLQGEWPLSLDDSIITAFENRPELDQALAQKAISEQQAIAARTANGPRVSLFGNYTQQNVVNQDLGWLDDYSFGARVSMRVFDGGAARARARQQQRNADIAAQQFSQTVDQVRFDVEQAYYNLQANQENITTAEVAVGQAKEALRLANLRFDAGVGTQLDVLQAQSEVTQAEVNYVQAVLGYNRSIVALQRAVSNLEGASEN